MSLAAALSPLHFKTALPKRHKGKFITFSIITVAGAFMSPFLPSDQKPLIDGMLVAGRACERRAEKQNLFHDHLFAKMKKGAAMPRRVETSAGSMYQLRLTV